MILTIFESCAIKQSGRLCFGEFLLACFLAKRNVCDFQVNLRCDADLSAFLTLCPPIPVHPAEYSEARVVGQDDGCNSDLFKAAILHISCPHKILFEPSVWTVAQAAVNERNCEVLRGVLSADFVLGQISFQEKPSICNSLAFILFSLSTSNPPWLLDSVNSVVRILSAKSLDSESSRLLLATIANIVTENEAIERLLNEKVNGSSSLEQMLELFQNIDGKISADLFRFFANVFLVSDDVRVETTKHLFLKIVFGRASQLLLSVDLHGSFYLLETLRRMMSSSDTLRRIFVQDVYGISALFNKVDQTVLLDPHVSPRLGILLSTLSSYSELGKSLIDQGALDLIHHLYSRCSKDEVVRVNCVQTIGDLVNESDSHDQKFKEARRILQEACERGTHIEVFSRALDAWGKIISIGGRKINDFQFEFGEVITISSFLLSDSVELKIKALKLLPFFLQTSENRLKFLTCEDFLAALSSCLCLKDSECRKDAVKSLALLARETTSPLALQISETLYELHGKINSESDLIIRGMLAYLFKRSRILTDDFTQKLSIVATGLVNDTNCQEAFLHVASDPEIAGNLSPFFTILYDLVNRPDINLTLAKSLSAFVGLAKNETVKAVILQRDISALAFRLVQTRNVYIAETGVLIIRYLLERCPENFLDSVCTPSRINMLTCLLSGADAAAKNTLLCNPIIAILHKVALAKKSTNTLLIDCLGPELRVLVETLIDRRDTPFLATIVWNVRVQRIIISNTPFLEELVLRVFSERQSLIDSIEFGRFQGDNSDNILASLQVLADLVSVLHCNTCFFKPEVLRILLEEIPALILNVANLDEVGRLRPSAVGPMQIPSKFFILLLQILRENTKCLKHSLNSINHIKKRLSKLWQIGSESQRVFFPHPSPVFAAVLEALTVFGTRIPGSLDRVSVNGVLKAAHTCPRECVEGTLKFCLMLAGTKQNVRDLVFPEFPQVASMVSSARGDSEFTNDEILLVQVMTKLAQVSISTETITSSGIFGVFPALACTGKLNKEKLIAKADMVHELMHFLNALSKRDCTILSSKGQVESFFNQVGLAFRGVDDELIRISEEIRSRCSTTVHK